MDKDALRVLLKHYREKSPISLARLGPLIGVHRVTLGAFVAGKSIGFGTWAKIERYLRKKMTGHIN